MLNLEETLSVSYYYNIQKDLYLKGILYIVGAIVFLDFLRSQVAEMNLLQLVPGSYLFLILISFVLLMVTSTVVCRIPFQFDKRAGFGTKTILRLDSVTRLNESSIFLLGFFVVSLNTIIPIGLDAFDSYDQETLTNLWSFEEVLGFESILFTILLTLSQVPVLVLLTFNTEQEMNQLPTYWKNLSFFTFVFAGFVTPTIDGYTQLNFSILAISLYGVIISLLEKRVSIKFPSTSSVNF